MYILCKMHHGLVDLWRTMSSKLEQPFYTHHCYYAHMREERCPTVSKASQCDHCLRDKIGTRVLLLYQSHQSARRGGRREKRREEAREEEDREKGISCSFKWPSYNTLWFTVDCLLSPSPTRPTLVSLPVTYSSYPPLPPDQPWYHSQ